LLWPIGRSFTWGEDWSSLFSEQDLPGSAHTDSGLIGSAIRSGLQSNDRFTSLQLLFSEMTPILLAGTRAEPRTAPFRMFVGLVVNSNTFINSSWIATLKLKISLNVR
jgi:hypothetical protein